MVSASLVSLCILGWKHRWRVGCILNAVLAAPQTEELFAASLCFGSTGNLKNKNCFVNRYIPRYIRSKFHSEPLPSKSLTSPMQRQQLTCEKKCLDTSAQFISQFTRSVQTAHKQQPKAFCTQRKAGKLIMQHITNTCFKRSFH